MIDKYIGYIADVRRYSQRTQQICRQCLAFHSPGFCEFFQSFLRERLVHIDIGILIESGRHIILVPVVGRDGEIWSEHDVGHGVGHPFQTHLSVP